MLGQEQSPAQPNTNEAGATLVTVSDPQAFGQRQAMVGGLNTTSTAAASATGGSSGAASEGGEPGASAAAGSGSLAGPAITAPSTAASTSAAVLGAFEQLALFAAPGPRSIKFTANLPRVQRALPPVKASSCAACWGCYLGHA